jgi:hypothetical protein
LLHLTLTLLAFATVASVVRSLVPPPDEYYYRSKLQYFEKHRDEFTTLLVGSSQTFRSCDPRIIDATLAEQGIDWRSFNLALPAMRDFEADTYLKRVVSDRPQKLRWVVMELSDFSPRLGGVREGEEAQREDDNQETHRSVYWHDAEPTWRAIQASWIQPLSFWEKLKLSAGHSRLWLRRLSSIDEGLRIVHDLRGAAEVDAVPDLIWEQQRGFIPLDQEGTPAYFGSARGAILQQRLQDYRSQVETLRLRSQNPPPLRNYNLAALERQQAVIEAAGARVIYVLPPGLHVKPHLYHLEEMGHVPALLAYTRPDQYPPLYQPKNRHNPTHLNQRGAAIFSQAFARALAEYLHSLSD